MIELSLVELFVSASTVFVGALFALVKWQLSREVKKIDKHGADIEQLSREKVGRDEMQGVVNRIAEQTSMVLAKVDRTADEMKTSSDTIHTRINDMGRRQQDFEVTVVREVAGIVAKLERKD